MVKKYEQAKLGSEIYVRPKRAWKKIKSIENMGQTVYIYGATGCGKTSFIMNFLKHQRYRYFSARTIGPKELELPISSTKSVVVIDDLNLAVSQEIREAIQNLAGRRDIWLILSGRSKLPPWLMPAYIKYTFMVIGEEDLLWTREEQKEFFCKWGTPLGDEDLERLYRINIGTPVTARLAAMELARGTAFDDDLVNKLRVQFWDYLEYHVYSQWDEDIRKFLIQVSIVERFDAEFARMVTGEEDAERLIMKALEIGNFLEEKDGKYELRYALRESMRRCLARKLPEEKKKELYYRAGMFYERSGQLPEALEMYKVCGCTERISHLLVENAKRNPGAGYYYELRKYYLSLPEERVKESPELMAGLSMLWSILMNQEESERWYDCLKKFKKESTGQAKCLAASWITYLDIGLPHRGSRNLIPILKNAGALLTNGQIILPEFSVTSNIPSMMNGGKDFCQWSKQDKALAVSIGKIVEIVLGKYGRGLVNLALAESFFEKGKENDQVSDLANRGWMQAESGGKLEQVFVAVGILARLKLISHEAEEGIVLLEEFRKKLQGEQGRKILMNLMAMECRLALYQGNDAEVDKWMEEAPSDSQEFCTIDRYRYLTKVRVYLHYGQYDHAMNLIQRLTYYAEVMHRTFIRMELKILTAVLYYRRKDPAWKRVLLEALKMAQEYHFVRVISREGAAVWELLKDEEWEISDKRFLEQVLRETRDMALAYPGYLRPRAHREVSLGENALTILRLQAEGLTGLQIAQQLGIKEETVRYHNKQTYKKLGVKGKAAAVNEARKRGLI